MLPADLDRSYFDPHLGSGFRMEVAPGQWLSVELVSVTGLPPVPTVARAPFSLMFLAPPGSGHPQRIYRLEHDLLPPLEIFLVPVGPEARGMRYEAIFS